MDDLLGDLAGGDPVALNAKRGPDSPDDFEHLLAASPGDSLSLLEAERRAEQFTAPPAEPALAERFTDSESDAESPLHRAQVAAPAAAAALLMDDDPPELAPPLLQPRVPSPQPDPLPPKQDPTPAPPPPETKEPAPPKLEPTVAPVPPKPEPKAEPAPPKPVFEVQKVQPAPEPPKPEPPRPQHAPPAPPAHTTPAPPARTTHVIEAEVIFCQMGLDAWFDPQRLHPEVESLLYWRCPARSGAALGAGLALLVALAVCSAVSVTAHVALLALAAAVAFRVYKSVMQAVQKTNDGHPFKAFLETDISVGADRATELAASATAHLNAATHELRRLFLVEDLVDSLKFGVLLWCLTYVGACFNGITLLILGWIGLFTLPKAYEMNKAQVDSNLELARAKINEITAKVRAAVPLGKKPESEKDK